MNFAELLEPYRNTEGGQDVTPESQLRWLKRLGFEQSVIDRVMIAVYTEIEQKTKNFKDWKEINLCLKNTAVLARAKDEAAQIKRIQDFEARLKKRWKDELPWWKWMLGIRK